MKVVFQIFLCQFLSSGPLLGYIFDSPTGSKRDPVVDFEKNECFKSNTEVTNWVTKQTTVQYNRLLRPGAAGGGNDKDGPAQQLRINVSIDMNSMASVDDINSEYKIILKIDLEWFDERLVYNCSNKPFTISMANYLLDRIWSPTLAVPNIKDPDTSVVQGEATLILGQLRTDGYVHIRLSLLLNLFCYLDFQLFPFDSQECFIKLESRSYSKSELLLAWREDHPFRNQESFQITGFKLIGHELYNDSTIGEDANLFKDIYGVAQGSGVVVKLLMKREWTNYFLEIYLPSVLFVMISWLSFWMNINSAPARVSLGMTTMLTLVTSSRATRDKLPRISYIQALDIWIAFCTCSIFLSLGEFALVSYIHRRAVRMRKEAEERQQLQQQRGSLWSTRCDSEIFSIGTTNSDKESSSQSTMSACTKCELLRRPARSNSTSTLLEMLTKLNRSALSHDRQLKCLGMATPAETITSRQRCCCLRNWIDQRGESLADAIDRWCRVAFPVGFIIFNIGYWCHYHT